MSAVSAKNDEASTPKRPSKPRRPAVHYPFWFGGSAASMAAIVTHPLDLVKVRLQTRAPDAPKTMIATFTNILRTQGIFGIYNGLSAALLRQLTYSTVRFGVYEDLKQRFAPKPTPQNPNPKSSFGSLILMSSFSGLCGGVVGNPGDVLNVRMQSDFAKPEGERRNYKHALDGLIRMVREEGVASLFRGVSANSARAVLMTSSQLASYDFFKHLCLDNLHMDDNLVTHFSSSLAAGFVATTICSPVDVVKTRVMSAGGKVPIMQLLRDATVKEGYLWMLRGWVPSFIRLGPQTVATMLFLEQHRKYYRKWKGLD